MHAFWAAGIGMAIAAVSMMTRRNLTSSQHQARKPRSITTGLKTVLTDRILLRMVICTAAAVCVFTYPSVGV